MWEAWALAVGWLLGSGGVGSYVERPRLLFDQEQICQGDGGRLCLPLLELVIKNGAGQTSPEARVPLQMAERQVTALSPAISICASSDLPVASWVRSKDARLKTIKGPLEVSQARG